MSDIESIIKRIPDPRAVEELIAAARDMQRELAEARAEADRRAREVEARYPVHMVLRRELTEVQRDAARYRWLRQDAYPQHVVAMGFGKADDAYKTEVGGKHYKAMAIQPHEYIVKNNIGWSAGNAIKYLSRYKLKGGAEDVRKAIHYCQLLLKEEYGE
jgi:hypothetical protein